MRVVSVASVPITHDGPGTSSSPARQQSRVRRWLRVLLLAGIAGSVAAIIPTTADSPLAPPLLSLLLAWWMVAPLAHLELPRRRLIVMVVGVAGGDVVANLPLFGHGSLVVLTFQQILERSGLVAGPVTRPGSTLMPIGPLGIELGVVLAMPLLIFQGLALVAASDSRSNRRVELAAAAGGSLVFLAGAALCYALVPLILPLLTGYAADGLQLSWTVGHFTGVVLTAVFWTGLACEMPVLLLALVALRVVTLGWLAHSRPPAMLGAGLLGAVLCPVPLLGARLVTGLFLYGLYELGIQVSRRTSRSVASS